MSSVNPENIFSEPRFSHPLADFPLQKPQLIPHTEYGFTTVEQQFKYYEQQMAGLDATRVLLNSDPAFQFLLTPGVEKEIDTQIERNAHNLNTADERYRATHDQLTGLLNRAGLESEMAKLRGDRPYIFLFADATNFKAVNDRFDHNTGDGMLREISAVLRISLRINDGDLLARIGGDEFVALIDTAPKGNQRRTGEESPTEQITVISSRIANEMDDMLSGYPQIRSVGFHLAVGAVLMFQGDTIDELKAAAEPLMRQQKTNQHHELGQNRPLK